MGLAVLLLAGQGAASEREAEVRRAGTARVQGLVDQLKTDLSLPHPVVVELVADNALMASVERVKGRDDTFRLSLDARFLDELDEDELRAVVAHELGHVWIFTHHPYLHTERLANQVAMRVVSREVLSRVYHKVWQRGGAKGDLARFLGE